MAIELATLPLLAAILEVAGIELNTWLAGEDSHHATTLEVMNLGSETQTISIERV